LHDHRPILNGLLYWLHTGVPWRDIPERYGPWQTLYARFRRWSRDGTWDRLLARLQRQMARDGRLEFDLWCIDGSSIRAHKAAAGAGKKPARRRAVASRPWAQPRRLRDEAAPAH
jgi:transposase